MKSFPSISRIVKLVAAGLFFIILFCAIKNVTLRSEERPSPSDLQCSHEISLKELQIKEKQNDGEGKSEVTWRKDMSMAVLCRNIPTKNSLPDAK